MGWDRIGMELDGSDRIGPEFNSGITLRGNFDVINVNVYENSTKEE